MKAAGLAGLGGANFPTSFKLTDGLKKHIDSLLINASECVLYRNSGYML